MSIFWSFFDDLTIFDKITKFTKTLPCFRNDILKITDLEISVILSVFDHFLIIFDDFVSFVKITKFTKTLPCFRNDILKITDLEILVIFVSFWSFLVDFSVVLSQKHRFYKRPKRPTSFYTFLKTQQFGKISDCHFETIV